MPADLAAWLLLGIHCCRQSGEEEGLQRAADWQRLIDGELLEIPIWEPSWAPSWSPRPDGASGNQEP